MLRRQFLMAAAGVLTSAPAFGQAARPAPTAPQPSTPAPPVLPNSVDAYRIVFDTWVAQHRPDTAIVVVRRNGRAVAAHGHNADANGPSLIGSMSKAITAVGVATLIRDGKLAFTTPMRDALAGFFKRHGRPPDRRFEAVTIEQLLVHRAGMLGNPDGDPVHKIRQDRAARGEGHLDVPQLVLAEHLKHPLKREPGTEMSYSGAGYMALAAVIEQQTSKPYEVFCREAIFAKLGIRSAQLHPDWRVLGASGGWFIAGDDYLRFLEVLDPAHPFLGADVKAWIDQAQTKWQPDNKGTWYSLGVYTSASAGRWRVEHGGGLNSHARDARGRPTHAVIESLGTRMANGNGAFLAITPAVAGGHKGFSVLRREIERAHTVVTKLS
jgi:CubicO group peptidase (beta-lactamase class C family)